MRSPGGVGGGAGGNGGDGGDGGSGGGRGGAGGRGGYRGGEKQWFGVGVGGEGHGLGCAPIDSQLSIRHTQFTFSDAPMLSWE